MKTSLLLAAFVSTASVGGAASAATIYADAVVEAIVGGGVRGPEGDTDPSVTAVGAPDGLFYSPGIGGLLVLGLPVLFDGAGGVNLFEITFVCDGGVGFGCANFPESAEIFVGSGWVAGGGDVDAALALNPGFVSVGVVSNDQAVGGFITAPVTGAFDQIAIVDRSTPNGLIETVNAGFDVDAVGVAPVPVPAALPLLALGLGGLIALGRRRA